MVPNGLTQRVSRSPESYTREILKTYDNYSTGVDMEYHDNRKELASQSLRADSPSTHFPKELQRNGAKKGVEGAIVEARTKLKD